MIVYKAQPEMYLDETLMKQVQVFTPYDDRHPCKYIGAAQIRVPNVGDIPIQFEIEADDVEQAFDKYDDIIQIEMARMAAEQQAAQAEAEAPVIHMPSKDIVV